MRLEGLLVLWSSVPFIKIHIHCINVEPSESLEEQKAFLRENSVCFCYCFTTLPHATDCKAITQCSECTSNKCIATQTNLTYSAMSVSLSILLPWSHNGDACSTREQVPLESIFYTTQMMMQKQLHLWKILLSCESWKRNFLRINHTAGLHHFPSIAHDSASPVIVNRQGTVLHCTEPYA